MTTVLLVDDHEIARVGVKYMLQSIAKVNVIGETGRGLEAVRLAKELNPDVVILDVHMPGMDGLEVTRKILLCNPAIRIIILSAFKEDPYPARLLEAGASAYLTKGCPPEEIAKAIRSVLSGKRYISPTIAHQLALKNTQQEETASFDILSLRELQIALMLIEGKEIKYISDTFYISPKTVMAYRHQIFKKLQVTNDVQLVLLAKKLGYLKETLAT